MHTDSCHRFEFTVKTVAAQNGWRLLPIYITYETCECRSGNLETE